jgi:hypothetical protein
MFLRRNRLRLIGRKNLCPSATSENKPPRSKTVAVIQNTILILEQFSYTTSIMINKTSLNFLLLDTSIIEDYGNQTRFIDHNRDSIAGLLQYEDCILDHRNSLTSRWLVFRRGWWTKVFSAN